MAFFLFFLYDVHVYFMRYLTEVIPEISYIVN